MHRQFHMMRTRVAILLTTGAFALPVGAQQVRVYVRDTTGAPVPGAEVTILRGLNRALASSLSNDSGLAVVPWRDTGDVQIVVRKIGFNRASRFFQAGDLGVPAFTIRLSPLIQQLEAVTVTERRRGPNYFIDADDIAKSTESIADAWDVVRKLRPEMATIRTGFAGCDGVRSMWVNGERVRAFYPDPRGRPNRIRPGQRVNPTLVWLLQEIPPEYISEIRYENCFSNKVVATGAQNALFIVLKPGIKYVEGVGAYVATESELAVDAARAERAGRALRAAGLTPD